MVLDGSVVVDVFIIIEGVMGGVVVLMGVVDVGVVMVDVGGVVAVMWVVDGFVDVVVRGVVVVVDVG